jgi:hypothetical protein
MQVYILESWNEDNQSEIEGVFSTRCLAEAHEWRCASNQEVYGLCTFYIAEETVDAMSQQEGDK